MFWSMEHISHDTPPFGRCFPSLADSIVLARVVIGIGIDRDILESCW